MVVWVGGGLDEGKMDFKECYWWPQRLVCGGPLLLSRTYVLVMVMDQTSGVLQR